MFRLKFHTATYFLRRHLEKLVDEFPHYHGGKYPQDQPLMISLHIPKTAGTSFRASLREMFGKTLHYDYGSTNATTSKSLRRLFMDAETSAAIFEAFSAKYAKKVRCIHGHFSVDKYWQCFPDANYVTWLREPVDRIYSQYWSHKRALDPHNEAGSAVYRGDLSFLDYARLERNRNLQTKLIGAIPLQSFSFVGITEMYDICFNRFLKTHGLPVHTTKIKRKNINRGGAPLDAETRGLVADLNPDDVALYKEAQRRYSDLPV